MPDQPALDLAAETYKSRQRKWKRPDGEIDQYGCWYPSADERRSCCDQIEQPTSVNRYALLAHCRTLRHVAHLYGVSVYALSAYMKEPVL